MTCENCLSYSECNRRGNVIYALKRKENGLSVFAEITCDYFKNKADYEKVVRCKDCKERYQYEEFDRNIGEMVICYGCSVLNRDLGDDGFCCYGERRTE